VSVMIETNAFFAMFAVLILTIALMHMLVLMRFVREKTAAMPEEYFAQIYPGHDRQQSTEKFVSRYRLAHGAVALVGMLLLGWLTNYMTDSGWDKRWVLFPVLGYFVLQWLPMVFTAIAGIKHMKALKSFFAQQKRKAALKRRGLSDFVSPFSVGLALLAGVFCCGFAIFASSRLDVRLWFIGALVFDYGLSAITVYRALYGRKSDPFETHVGRLRTIGLRVRSTVYSCIAVALFMPCALAAVTFGLDQWMPFALATFLTAMTLITFGVFIARPGDLETNDRNTSEVAS
jgi:hypothetical protein